MIRAVVDKRRAVVTGHAGYAACGSDIVCAAVSILVYVQVRLLERAGALEALHSRSGYVAMTLQPDCGMRPEVLALGLKWLAREYPDCVQLEDKGVMDLAP